MPFFSFLPHLARQPPKFGSLDALKQAGAGGGEDSDEEEQKFFVGGMGKGGGGSGQSVIDPKKIMESAQVRVPCDLFAMQACDWAAFDRAVPSMPAQQNGADLDDNIEVIFLSSPVTIVARVGLGGEQDV